MRSPLWHFTHFACRMPRTDDLNSSVPFAIFATWSGSTGWSFAWGAPVADDPGSPRHTRTATSVTTGNRRTGSVGDRRSIGGDLGAGVPYGRDDSSAYPRRGVK